MTEIKRGQTSVWDDLHYCDALSVGVDDIATRLRVRSSGRTDGQFKSGTRLLAAEARRSVVVQRRCLFVYHRS
jgi:hypothetical protein